MTRLITRQHSEEPPKVVNSGGFANVEIAGIAGIIDQECPYRFLMLVRVKIYSRSPSLSRRSMYPRDGGNINMHKPWWNHLWVLSTGFGTLSG